MDQSPSWDGLEDVVPEGFRDRVHEYLKDAEERIHVLLEEDKTLLNTVRQRTQRFRGGKVHNAARKKLIIQCLSVGMTPKKIAHRLGVTVYVVNNDLASMKYKFKCRTSTELVARALRTGFIE